MYTFFEGSTFIDSSDDYQKLVKLRYEHIQKLLKDNYKYEDEKEAYEANDTAIIRLIKDNETKKLSILWSSNTVDNNIENDNNTENDNNVENDDKVANDQNNNEGIILNDDTDINDVDDTNAVNNNNILDDSKNNDLLSSVNINKSALNVDDLLNRKKLIINNILYFLNNTEFNSAYIPPKIVADQIKELLKDENFTLYRQQLLNAILDGRNTQEIIIPIKPNMDMMNIYSFCYILILREYQFDLNVDDEFNLHINIKW